MDQLSEHDYHGRIGVDEAGRGCLAGPVVAAAVLFSPNFYFQGYLPYLDDSKKLSEKFRDRLAPDIKRHAAVWSIGVSWPKEIDTVNILNATFRAMSRAVAALKLPGFLPELLIDGNHVIRHDAWRFVTDLPCPAQTAIIDGDALVPQISAASILAKTFRDALMRKLDTRYPGYGFADHKGYGTKSHRDAIIARGPCAMHRKTFRGVRKEPGQLTFF